MANCTVPEQDSGCIKVNTDIFANEIIFPFDITGKRIYMQMRQEFTTAVVFSFDTEDGTIVQTDTNTVVMPVRTAIYPVGVYYGDLAIDGLSADENALFIPYRRKITITNSYTRPTS